MSNGWSLIFIAIASSRHEGEVDGLCYLLGSGRWDMRLISSAHDIGATRIPLPFNSSVSNIFFTILHFFFIAWLKFIFKEDLHGLLIFFCSRLFKVFFSELSFWLSDMSAVAS